MALQPSGQFEFEQHRANEVGERPDIRIRSSRLTGLGPSSETMRPRTPGSISKSSGSSSSSRASSTIGRSKIG